MLAARGHDVTVLSSRRAYDNPTREFAAAERWVADRGIPKLQLMIRETNTEVVRFYERVGFENAPRTIMQKWL